MQELHVRKKGEVKNIKWVGNTTDGLFYNTETKKWHEIKKTAYL